VNFNWETLLDLAQELFEAAETESGQKREALLRTATSRAYYAAFGASVVWLREHYPTHPLPGHGEIHKATSDFFLFHPEPAGRAIGELLRDLRLARNRADYRTRIPDSKGLAERNLFDANRALNALGSLEI
jgi:hypothetical protein